MLDLRSFLQLLCLVGTTLAGSSSSGSFENIAVVRAVDLGGAATHVTTTYQIRSLQDGNDVYHFALSKEDVRRTSWIDVKIKGSNMALPLVDIGGATGGHSHHYSVKLPQPLRFNETGTLIFSSVQTHASEPLPEKVRQTEPLGLMYRTELYILSPYKTAIQRLKLRSPTANIISYSEPKYSKYAEGDTNPVTKAGATLTFGPFRGVPPSSDVEFITNEQKRVHIHFEYDAPVTTIKKLTRSVELSHWGSNMNVQDVIWLKNAGAELKGHFSRLEHIKQNVHVQTAQPHVIRNLILHLPSGVRDAYYYDVIGNVSTSHFRPAPVRKATSSPLKRVSPLDRTGVLELKPRYPLMGGWNYTFTMGYDLPLGDWVGYDQAKKAYIAAVPFMTAIPGAAFDDVEVKIILPEGAKIVGSYSPFAMDSESGETHITYLDTVGRPAIVLKKQNAVSEHAKLVYVIYTVDAQAHLRKVITVAGAFMGIFVLGMTLRRVDFRIHSEKRKHS